MSFSREMGHGARKCFVASTISYLLWRERKNQKGSLPSRNFRMTSDKKKKKKRRRRSKVPEREGRKRSRVAYNVNAK